MANLSETNSSPADADDRLANIKILVMDSSSDAAALIKKIFVQLGFTNVVVANDGFSGVQAVKEGDVNLIFTDRELKVVWNVENALEVSKARTGEVLPLSGVLFTQRLRQSSNSPNPYLPVIMMLDGVTEEDVGAARDSGVNEVLTRPIQADDFCKRIISIIDNPRLFIAQDNYKGPCRRRKKDTISDDVKERRVRKMRVMKVEQ